MLNQLGDVLPNVFVRRDDGALAITDDFELAWQSFGNELDRDCAKRMLSRFVLQSAASFAAPSTAPDPTHPTTYICRPRVGRLAGRAGSNVNERRSRRSLSSRAHVAAFSAA